MVSRGIGEIHGQGNDITTPNLARINMQLSGLKDNEFGT